MERSHGREFQAMSGAPVKKTAGKPERKQPECSDCGGFTVDAVVAAAIDRAVEIVQRNNRRSRAAVNPLTPLSLRANKRDIEK